MLLTSTQNGIGYSDVRSLASTFGKTVCEL